MNESYIVMSRAFYDNLMSNEFLWALVWHEIGHFHSIPFVLDNREMSVKEQRKKYAVEGNVMIDEQLADLFAVYSCGKENTIKALRWAREDCKMNRTDAVKELAVKEYNARIHLIKSIEEGQALQKYYELLEKNRIIKLNG